MYRCQDGWKTIVEMPHPFLLPGMVVPTILAVVPPHEPELIEETLAAGADKTGSGEIIKAIQVRVRISRIKDSELHPSLNPMCYVLDAGGRDSRE